jgi:hypothetical protein
MDTARTRDRSDERDGPLEEVRAVGHASGALHQEPRDRLRGSRTALRRRASLPRQAAEIAGVERFSFADRLSTMGLATATFDLSDVDCARAAAR